MISVSTLCLLKILPTTKKLLLLAEKNLKNLKYSYKTICKKIFWRFHIIVTFNKEPPK